MSRMAAVMAAGVAMPGARDDEPEVGDGGVGEDLLAVALAAGQGGSGPRR